MTPLILTRTDLLELLVFGWLLGMTSACLILLVFGAKFNAPT